ncbi:MAG: protein kinase [Deltaproteobacteria bacterium]|nr:protein kinase [Deltaproteobacteria bacterium]
MRTNAGMPEIGSNPDRPFGWSATILSGTPELAPTSWILDGQYELLRELGRGGVGIVYLAEDLRLKRHVAIKVLAPSMLLDPKANDRFEREAMALAALRHPNVMPIHAMGIDPQGYRYIVMEYVQGETLEAQRHRLASCGDVMPITRAIEILEGVAAGLSAAHEAGIVHRDVSGANVILAQDDQRPVLTDFGMARVLGHAGLSLGICGTPRYLAPETLSGHGVRADLAPLVDLYAMGVIAFELFTGRPPFESGDLFELMRMHRESPPPLPSYLRPDLPAAVDNVIVRALAKDPLARPPSCDALARALREALEERTSPLAIERPLSASRAKLLIATPDDTLASRLVNAIARHLDARRFVVCHARDGYAAWNHARARTPEALVCDTEVTGLNVVELLALLRGHPGTERMPVVVITAQPLSPADRSLFDRLGMRRLVSPDATDDQLARVIRSVVSGEARVV